MDWRLNVMAPGQVAYTPEDAALSVKLFACEAIRSGTTAVVTNERIPVPLAEAMIEAMDDSGMRSVFALSFNETSPSGETRRAGALPHRRLGQDLSAQPQDAGMRFSRRHPTWWINTTAARGAASSSGRGRTSPST